MSYHLNRGLGGLDPTSFSALANAIFRQEGSQHADGSWNTAALGYRLNNPGNLVYAGQAGAHPVTQFDPAMGVNQTYASWDTLDAGVLGTEKQLALDASRGLTLAQRLASWATGNKTAYINNVSSWLGVSPDTPLTQLSDFHLVPSIPALMAGHTTTPAPPTLPKK